MRTTASRALLFIGALTLFLLLGPVPAAIAAATGITTQQTKTGAPGPVTAGAVAAEGTSLAHARADHVHSTSGVAATDAEFVTYAANATLTNERVLNIDATGDIDMDGDNITDSGEIFMRDNTAVCLEPACQYWVLGHTFTGETEVGAGGGFGIGGTVKIDANTLSVPGNLVMNGTITDSSGAVNVADDLAVVGNISPTGWIPYEADNYSGGWARGFIYSDGASEVAGIGAFGGAGTFTHLFMGVHANYYDAANGLTVTGSGSSDLKWKNGQVWHAANDGSGSGLDADQLDARTSTDFVWAGVDMPNATTTDAATDLAGITDVRHYGGSVAGDTGYPQSNGQILGYKQSSNDYSYSWQIFTGFDSNTPYYRSVKNDASRDWTAWQAMWHAGNDGVGSTLDADTVDGATATDDSVLVANGTDWQTKTIPDCDTAGTSKLLYDTTTNAFSCGTDTDTDADTYSWRTAGKVFYDCLIATPTSTGHTCNGATVPGVTASPTASPQTNRMYLNYATTNVSGNSNGHPASTLWTRPGWRNIYWAQFMTEGAVSLRRQWLGLAESTMAALAVRTEASGAAASSIDFVAVGWDTAVTANFMCCSGDGTNYSCKDMGVAPAIDTEYTVTINWATAGTIDCKINSTTVTKTTNLSTGAVNIGPNQTVTTLSGAIVNMRLGAFSVERN